MQIIITDNTVIYEEKGDTPEKIGVNVGDVFNVLDSCEDGWWIKTGRYTIPVTKAEAKVYTQRHLIMMLVPTTLREVAVNENSNN